MTEGPKRGTGVLVDAVGLGLNVVVAAFLFGFVGHWIGKRVGAHDVLTLIGGLCGAGVGFYSLFVRLSAPPQEDPEKKSK